MEFYSMAILTSNIQLQINDEYLTKIEYYEDNISILSSSNTRYVFGTGTKYNLYIEGSGLNSYFSGRLDAFGITTRNGDEYLHVTNLNRPVSFLTIDQEITIPNLLKGDDLITGSAFADTIRGFGGDDTIDGGGSVDVAVYAGLRSQHTVTKNADGSVTVQDNATTGVVNIDEGTDTLRNIELIRFADSNLVVNDIPLPQPVVNVIHQNIIGTDGNDTLATGLGNDTIQGGLGNDNLNGSGGNDSIHGGNGADILLGEAGNDYVQGNIGTDTVSGNAGNDTVSGDKGFDTLHGGQGDELLIGGEHNDILSGDKGNDTLIGGSGEDGFVFGNITGIGNDVITDFEQNTDTLFISSAWYASNAAAVAAFENGTLALGDQGSVQLLAISELSVNDIVIF